MPALPRPRPQTSAQRPGGWNAAAHISRRINKLPRGREDLTVPSPLWHPCCPFLSLPREPSPYSSFLLRSPRCRSHYWYQVGKPLKPPESLALNLGEGVQALGRSPPTSNFSPGAEPSGRDLGGGWEWTAPGKKEGFLVEPGPEVSLFFPAARHR